MTTRPATPPDVRMSAQTPQNPKAAWPFPKTREELEFALLEATKGLVNAAEDAEKVRADLSHYKALCEELREALDHILWIKDCGIDGKNEKGEFVNWPADERNAMYEIAKAALKKAQKDI